MTYANLQPETIKVLVRMEELPHHNFRIQPPSLSGPYVPRLRRWEK